MNEPRVGAREARGDAPVFCGLEGKRLQPTILAAIIRRATEWSALEKRVTAQHTPAHRRDLAHAARDGPMGGRRLPGDDG